MIGRIWHGWTLPEKADIYEKLLKSQVIPGIAAMKIPGYRNIQVLRRSHGNEVEFITIMRFDSIEAVKKFVGNNYERAHVPPDAREVLAHFDQRSQHYEIVEEVNY